MYLSTKPNRIRIFLVVASLFLACNIHAKINYTKTPEWVQPQKLNPMDTIPEDQIKKGTYYVLIDRQINTITKQSYFHYAYRVATKQGVQDNSEISVNYCPAYQKFSFHSIVVIRDGKRINEMSLAKINEIQQEKDLDSYIYDESLNVYAILKDIRPNDIIEYEYTIEGFNPIFDNKRYFIFSPYLEYELSAFYFRIVKSNEILNCKFYSDVPRPQVIKKDNHEEWIWDCRHNKAYEEDESTPDWFRLAPFVEISGFSSWKDVEEWGLKVFKNDDKLSEKLAAEIKSIELRYSTPKEKAVAALRFVQKKIRYFGVEVGVNSHKPNSPNKVFAQRFGDCKDKSLLLCKMLNNMGIEAYPVLISTWLKGEIFSRQPSGMLFDHTTVQAIIDGKKYWFDSTIDTQEGDLENTDFPNYKFGLVLDGKFGDLDPIENKPISKTFIKELYHVEDFDGNATLHVETTYRGGDADNIRYTFESSSIKDVQKNYLAFYKKSYDSVSVAKTLYFEDDTIKNTMKVFESYRIKTFWDKSKPTVSSSIYSYFINDKLNQYSSLSGLRKCPLELEFPLSVYHSIEVEFPENWSINAYNEFVNNDYFLFHSTASCNGNTCSMVYDYENLSDYVPADKVGAFLKDVSKIDKSYSGIEFTYNPSFKTEDTNKAKSGSGLAILFLFSIGLFAYFSRRIFINRGPFEDVDIYSPKIGGWLVLPTIGLFLTPIIALVSLVNGNFLNTVDFQTYTNPASSTYNSLWGTYWIINIIGHSAYMVFPVLILILFFHYDRRSAIFAKWFYIGNLLFCLLILFLAKNISNFDTKALSSLWNDASRAIIVSAVWIPYFQISTRVKETFVR